MDGAARFRPSFHLSRPSARPSDTSRPLHRHCFRFLPRRVRQVKRLLNERGGVPPLKHISRMQELALQTSLKTRVCDTKSRSKGFTTCLTRTSHVPDCPIMLGDLHPCDQSPSPPSVSLLSSITSPKRAYILPIHKGSLYRASVRGAYILVSGTHSANEVHDEAQNLFHLFPFFCNWTLFRWAIIIRIPGTTDAIARVLGPWARMSYPAPNYYVYGTMMAILARTIDLAHTRETRLLTYLCKRPLPATPGRLFQRRGEKQNWQNDIVARRALQRRNKPFAACRRCFFVCECENAITGSLMLWPETSTRGCPRRRMEQKQAFNKAGRSFDTTIGTDSGK
ncbi:hypothetical protein IWZ01DRAFT_365813 [Phyllosticta capitalensis]